VVATVRAAIAQHGVRASVLTDTGTVLTSRVDRDIRLIDAGTGELLRGPVLATPRDDRPRNPPGRAEGPNP
jgi:hypothetical protein